MHNTTKFLKSCTHLHYSIAGQFCHDFFQHIVTTIVQIQKISIHPSRKVFLFCTPLPSRNSSFASYFASKILAFKTGPIPPRNFRWPSLGWVWIFFGTAHSLANWDDFILFQFKYLTTVLGKWSQRIPYPNLMTSPGASLTAAFWTRHSLT